MTKFNFSRTPPPLTGSFSSALCVALLAPLVTLFGCDSGEFVLNGGPNIPFEIGSYWEYEQILGTETTETFFFEVRGKANPEQLADLGVPEAWLVYDSRRFVSDVMRSSDSGLEILGVEVIPDSLVQSSNTSWLRTSARIGDTWKSPRFGRQTSTSVFLRTVTMRLIGPSDACDVVTVAPAETCLDYEFVVDNGDDVPKSTFVVSLLTGVGLVRHRVYERNRLRFDYILVEHGVR
jgi:hypothetical protein